MNRPKRSDAATPSRTPHPESQRPCSRTIRRISLLSAPRARRSPISRVRNATPHERTPARPTAARPSAHPANIDKSASGRRLRATFAASRSSPVAILPSGTSRSIDETTSRRAGRMESGSRSVRQDDGSERIGGLELRPEHLRLGRLVERLLPHVSHDAHDGPPRLVAHPDARSERILARPESTGHGLVHDGDSGAFSIVSRREITAAEKRNSHGREVSRAREVERRVSSFAWSRFLGVLDLEVPAA